MNFQLTDARLRKAQVETTHKWLRKLCRIKRAENAEAHVIPRPNYNPITPRTLHRMNGRQQL